MAVRYTQAQITAGIAYSDTLTIDDLAFAISTEATNAVTAILLDRKPAAELSSPPTVIISSVNVDYVSGSRAAGEESTWSLTFTEAQTNLLLRENKSISYNEPVIQVTIRGAQTTEREVFTSDPLSVGVSMEAVTSQSS